MTGPSATSDTSRLRAAEDPSLFDKLRRATWVLVSSTLYAWSPVPMHGWRRVLLRLFGARVGARVHPYPSARIWAPWNLDLADGSCLGPRSNCYAVAKIRLGLNTIVSQGAHLCAASHDHRDIRFTLLVGEIDLRAGAWVAADAFVGPGVVVGERAVVAARAVVIKDVEADVVVAGNPARKVGMR
jgi:putative colanic acid biosynthesis acetyltransferase WcaF